MINFVNVNNYQLIPMHKSGTCFGCGPKHKSGLHMQFRTDEKSVFSKLKIPNHLTGWSNIVHGGVTTTVLDETMAWTVIYFHKTYMLTKSIKVDFMRPLLADTEYISLGNVLEIKNEKDVTVEACIYDINGKIHAKGIGELVIFPPEAMRKKGMFSEEFLSDFEKDVFV